MNVFQDEVKEMGLEIFQLMDTEPSAVTEKIMRRGVTPEIIS